MVAADAKRIVADLGVGHEVDRIVEDAPRLTPTTRERVATLLRKAS
jgi:hypothetical protein